MLKAVQFFLLILFVSTRAWSAGVQVTQDMNLGTYIQIANAASGVLSYSSTVSNLSGVAVGSSSLNAAGVLRLNATGAQETVVPSMQTSSVILSNTVGCTITAQSFTFSSPQINLQDAPQDLMIGATFVLSGGFCQEGTYTGMATVQLTSGCDKCGQLYYSNHIGISA